MSFSFYGLRLIEIKERGIIVTTKAYSEKLLRLFLSSRVIVLGTLVFEEPM